MAFDLKKITSLPTGNSIRILPLAEAGSEWIEYLMDDDQADICHHPAWGNIFADAFGFGSILILHYNGEKIDGGLPLVLLDQKITGKAMISMPYHNYGGLLAKTDTAKTEIVDFCRQTLSATGADYIELRHTGSGLGPLADQTVENRITFRLNINRPADDIFSGFKKQLRTRLRKTDRLGLEYYQGREKLDDFYRLFSQAMKEHGTPVMPRRYFAAVLKHLKDHARLMIAYKNKRPVGGKLYMTFKNRATMTRGCYPNKYKHLMANYLLTWELIRQLAEGPCTLLDFGRSAPGSGSHSYKSNWGPEEIPIFVDYLAANPNKIPNLKPENSRFGLAIACWKRLPLPIANLVGPRLSRYFP